MAVSKPSNQTGPGRKKKRRTAKTKLGNNKSPESKSRRVKDLQADETCQDTDASSPQPADAKSSGNKAKNTGSIASFGAKERRVFLRAIESQSSWEDWAAALATQKHLVSLRTLLDQSTSADSSLKWSYTDELAPATQHLVSCLTVLRRKKRKTEVPGDWSVVVTDWLEQIDLRPVDINVAIELLALTHALPKLSVRLTGHVWTELFAKILNHAIEALQSFAPGTPHGFVVAQLTAGELPLTLGFVFPQLDVCQDLAALGRQVTAAGLLEVLDGEGTPHAKYHPIWFPLLATWTRTLLLDRQVKRSRVDADARLQFEWLVRQTLRWLRADGTLLLETTFPQDLARDIMSAALWLGGDQVDKDLEAISKGRLKADDSEYDLPQPGENSAWSQLAVLRAGWKRRDARLAVNYHDPSLPSEFSLQKSQLWFGPIAPEITFDGRQLAPVDDWEELCWTSDDDLDFIELEIGLDEDFTLQRQLLVAREDRFALLADAIVGEMSGMIDYRLQLPICADLQPTPSDEHTEVTYAEETPLAVAMPLCLSEWRSANQHGRFDGSTLEYRRRGIALYAPLFIDFDRRRLSKPRTWRQLTVAQNLQLVGHDKAAAFRIQVGKKQWVVYRSLGPAANRTFLGQNTTSELIVARFLKDGELEPLVEIE